MENSVHNMRDQAQSSYEQSETILKCRMFVSRLLQPVAWNKKATKNIAIIFGMHLLFYFIALS